MAGHSRWTQIKHQKGAADARRGQLFTKLAREITVAARQGGGDPDLNVRLRLAVQRAKESNMPWDNVERAIKRGTGEGDGTGHLEETTYEGYGPGGAAIMLQALTDNRNRTAAEVRTAFARGGGSLGEAGCVSWVFQPRGVITIEAESDGQAEEVALAAIDAGAEDFKQEEGYLEVYVQPEGLEGVRQALEATGVSITSAELSMVPSTPMPLDPGTAEQTLRLLDRLEDLDDVQKVYTNADFPLDVLEAYRKEG